MVIPVQSSMETERVFSSYIEGFKKASYTYSALMDISQLDRVSVDGDKELPVSSEAVFFEQTRWGGRQGVKPKIMFDCTDKAVIVVVHTSHEASASWNLVAVVAAAQIAKIRRGKLT
jgi:hypothetical protein